MMIELSIIRDLVAIFGVIAGFTYYVLTVRNAQRTRELTLRAQEQALDTRQAQLVMNLVNTVRSTDFRRQWHTLFRLEWRDYQDFQEQYEEDIEIISAWTSVVRFYECVGVMVKNNLIDMNLIYPLLVNGTKIMWDRYEPLIMGDRERFQEYGTIWTNVEYLYNEILRYEEEHPELKT